MEIGFWVLLFFVIFTYAGYPVSLWLIAKIYRYTPKLAARKNAYSVTIVIPAHNEEAVIADKIQNSLSQDYTDGLLKVLCVSDGSTDKTVEIAEKFGDTITLIEINDRKGKTNVINRAMESVDTDIVVFTDANITLASNAVSALVNNFSDDSVGCVAGQLTHINADETATAASVSFYWRYEEFIKLYESHTGSIVGADGAIFAIRTPLFKPLPLYVIDDFTTSMSVLIAGHRVLFDPTVKASEKASTDREEELKRKIRIATRSVSASLYMGSTLYKLNFFNTYKYFCHRVLRYLGAYLLILLMIFNVLLAKGNENLIYGVILFGQIVFYMAAVYGVLIETFTSRKLSKLVRIPAYFLMVNIVSCIGATKAVLGAKVSYWKSPESAR